MGAAFSAGPAHFARPSGPRHLRQAPRSRRRGRAVVEWVVILALALLAALLLRTFVVQPYYIPSGSMEPTLEIHDKVLVNKLSYHFHGVHRGDIIVFEKPPNDPDSGIKDLIKRVIGLPGETISLSGGQVYINGKLLKEPWLPAGVTTGPEGLPKHPYSLYKPFLIPPDEYFVMGDNRDNSDDSRYFGPIPRSLIVGRAFLIVWPVSRIRTL